MSSSVRIVAGRDRGRSEVNLVSAPPFQRSVRWAANAVALDFDDDLVDERSQQFLSVSRRRRVCPPNRSEIWPEREEAVAFLLVDRRRTLSFTASEIGFGGLQRLQAFFPLAFEPTRDEAVVRVDGSIAAFCALGFVAGALHGQSPLLEDGLAIGLEPFGGGERRRQLCGLQGGKERFGDGVVDLNAADIEAIDATVLDQHFSRAMIPGAELRP